MAAGFNATPQSTKAGLDNVSSRPREKDEVDAIVRQSAWLPELTSVSPSLRSDPCMQLSLTSSYYWAR